jgi:hypothetical protein
MNLQTLQTFRLLLIASLVVGLGSGFADMVFPELLPEAFHQTQAEHDADWEPNLSLPHVVLLGVLLVATVLSFIAGFYGLYRLRDWAPRVALLSTVLGVVLVMSSGPMAQSPLAVATAYLSSYLWGAVLVLAHLPAYRARFQATA